MMTNSIRLNPYDPSLLGKPAVARSKNPFWSLRLGHSPQTLHLLNTKNS